MTKTRSIGLLVALFVFFVLPLGVFGQASVIGTRKISPYYPDSWFSAPKTASQMGIKVFHQSPYLDAMVKSGKLPPLAKRLPDDPVVTQVVEKIGTYGGRMRVVDWPPMGLDDEGMAVSDPNGAKVLPNALTSWEYKNDGKTLVMHLRKGLKWSDGVPFTSDDIVFWWKYMFPDPELNPLYEGSAIVKKVTNVTAIDTYTAQLDFSTTNPFFIVEDQQLGGGSWWWGQYQPAHFLKKFHPAFVPQAQLDKMVKAAGFDHWQQLFNRERQWDILDPAKEELCPTFLPYMPKERGPTYTIFQRNPYYWKIDPAGNQLPYIDEVYQDRPESTDTVPLKLFAGEYDIGQIKPTDVPAFQKNAARNNYHLLFYTGVNGADLMFFVNMTSQNPDLRKIFSDLRFRKALSLSIDRATVNKVYWLGVAVPRQYTVVETSAAFDPKFASAFTQYDTAQAAKLLDDMGMKVGSDGMRQTADGKPLAILCEAIEDSISAPAQMVIEGWKKLGLNITLKMTTRDAVRQRGYGNLIEMYANAASALSVDLSFARRTGHAPIENTEESPWKAYEDWYLSGGKVGEEPPANIKQLTQWFDVMSTTIDDNLRVQMEKNILQSNADNLWYIGVVGEAPQIFVASNRLHNMPTQALYGWDTRYWQPYHPEQFYLTK